MDSAKPLPIPFMNPIVFNVGEVSSIFTFSSRFTKKKTKSKNTPKKLKSSPTTLVTETSATECEYAANFTDVQCYNLFITMQHLE